MATIQWTEDRNRGDARLFTWEGLTTGDVGTSLTYSGFRDRTVQVVGTFGGATAVLEGSNDGENWKTLTDPQGNPLSFNAAGLETVMEAPLFMRPAVTGGTSPYLTFILCAGRSIR